MTVRRREDADRAAVKRFLDERHTAEVARLGRLERALDDNVDALRFYQRRGFGLAELHAGGVDDARSQLKPEIPETGEYGVPLREELVLEKELSAP